MQPVQSNVYISLQRLVWAAFIGVLSFQVLAPNVWSYVNQVLGFSFQEGYRSFVVIYAWALLIILFIWLLNNRSEIQACLFPGGIRKQVTVVCGIFLAGLLVSIVIQFAAIGVFLTRYEIESGRFVNVQRIILALNAALLVTGIWISLKRIQVFLSPSKNPKVQALCKRALLILAGWIIVALMLGLFGGLHWKHNHDKYYSGDSTTIANGFQYLNERAHLDSLLKSVKYRQESLNTFLVMANIDSASELSTMTEQSSTSPALAAPGKHTIKKNGERQKINVVSKEKESLEPFNRLNAEYKMMIRLITLNRDLALKSAQKILGRLLRDHQLKMTYLFLNIFIILISLYVFLRLDFLIKEYGFEESDRLSKLYPNALELKEASFKADDTRKNSAKLSTDIWLYITLAIWLLVPLFKPVEDDKIDPKAPFKMLTLSGPGAPWEKWITTTQDNDVTHVENNIETVTISKLDRETIVLLQDSMKVIRQLLNSINVNTKTLIDKNDELINNSNAIIKRNDTLIVRADTLININRRIEGRIE